MYSAAVPPLVGDKLAQCVTSTFNGAMHICSITHMHSVSTQPFCGCLESTFKRVAVGIVPSARVVCDAEERKGVRGVVKGF